MCHNIHHRTLRVEVIYMYGKTRNFGRDKFSLIDQSKSFRPHKQRDLIQLDIPHTVWFYFYHSLHRNGHKCQIKMKNTPLIKILCFNQHSPMVHFSLMCISLCMFTCVCTQVSGFTYILMYYLNQIRM